MDESLICRQAVYSEDYADYILDEGGNLEAVRRKYNPACLQPIDGSFLTIYTKAETSDVFSFEKHGYGAVPKCFGLLDTSSVEATGALRVRGRQNFELTGSGVLFGCVDAGIDFTNPVFQNADGTTRISYIWDQSVQDGTGPEGIFYGAEYTREEINRALESKNPREVIPVGDFSYHGTFVTAIAAGNSMDAEDFTGMAPGAEIMVVRVKEAKESLRRFFGIPAGVPCFQENDIMMGVRYLWEKAQRLKKPLVICIGMGTNSGDHSGFSPLSTLINRIGNLGGVCIVGGAGNETNLGHHVFQVLNAGTNREVELNVEKDTAMTVELWTDSVSALEVAIIAPDGETSGQIPIREYEQRVEYIFARTRIYVYYQRVEYYSGEEVVVLRMKNLEEGIWRLKIINVDVAATDFHMWLPMREFVNASRFLSPTPDTIVCNPGNTYQIITAAAYNHRDNTIYVNSSRGFTASYAIKPDLAAPGVEVYGPVSPLRYGYRSGTSIGAAHTAGAVLLLLEWAVIRENNVGMNTVTAKNYLIRGARKEGMEVPNRSFGWGILDIYNTFDRLRNL